MSDNVNSPSHYKKAVNDGRFHPECVDMLEFLTQGYSGIAAGDVMQSKYCYRAGSKSDAKMSIIKKALEDYSKLDWYMKDFERRAIIASGKSNIIPVDKLPEGFYCSVDKPIAAIKLIAQEFSFDKPKEIKGCVEHLITKIACMRTFLDIRHVKSVLADIIGTLKSKVESENTSTSSDKVEDKSDADALNDSLNNLKDLLKGFSDSDSTKTISDEFEKAIKVFYNTFGNLGK